MLKKLKGLILFLVLVSGIYGQNSQTSIQKCWEFNDKNILSQKYASDNNSNFVFLKDNGSSVISSINDSGEILWANDLGGDARADTLIIKNKVFILVESESESGNSIDLRAVSLETGLTNWQKKLNTAEAKEIKLFEVDGFLAVFVDKKKILLFQTSNGELMKTVELENVPKTNFAIGNYNIFYVGENGAFLSLNIQKGISSVLYQFKNSVSKVFQTKEDKVLVIDELNNLIDFEPETKKIGWTNKIGAGVSSVSETNNYYLIASFDNYIYCIKKENGSLVWKKRTEGRPEGALTPKHNLYAASIINGQVTLISELEKGKTVNQIVLSEGEYFVSKPIFLGRQMILLTNTGLRAYSFEECK